MDWQKKQRKKLGRPLEGNKRKERINITIDPDVLVKLEELDNKSAFIERLVKEELGL